MMRALLFLALSFPFPQLAPAQEITAQHVYKYGVVWTQHVKDQTNERYHRRIPEWFLPNLAGPMAKNSIEAGDIGFIAMPFKVFQVVDESNVIIELSDESHVWMSNISTDQTVDEMQAVLSNPVVVKGNKSYVTALGGRRTILEVGVIDRDVCAGALDLWQRSKWTDREWSDTTGSFKIQAAMVDFDESKVRLRKQDGSTVEVPLEKLSPTDRTWIKRNTLPRKFQKYLGN